MNSKELKQLLCCCSPKNIKELNSTSQTWHADGSNGTGKCSTSGFGQMARKQGIFHDVPKEIVARIAVEVDYFFLRKLSTNCAPLKDILDSGYYWRIGGALTISSPQMLFDCVLKDSLTKAAIKIDFRDAKINDSDLYIISKYFHKIESIYLGRNEDITDDGIAKLIRRHSKTLKKISLDGLVNLTDKSLYYIGKSCNVLDTLILDRCNFSVKGLNRLFETSLLTNLRHLSLSRCYLLECSYLPIIFDGKRASKLQSLNLSFLEFLQATHVHGLLDSGPASLRRIDVRSCPEITLKNIQEFENFKKIKIIHNAQIEDHTIDGIRRFILGLYT